MNSHCHPSRLSQARGLCKPCYDRWLKSVNPEYKKRQAAICAAWKVANPEAWAAIRERRRAKVKSDPKYRREIGLVKKYRMTLLDYDNLLAKQGGGCALCGRLPGKTPLHVDHDHATNRIRGILCHQCNWYMGTIDRKPEIIDRIIAYKAAQ